jgi:tRNA-splicing ligase RtcB
MAKDSFRGPLEQVDPHCWRIPKSYKAGMRVDGLIFSNDRLLPQLLQDQAPEQVANVAFLPGIRGASLAMPDIHWGYGFCIGGVAATDPDEGGVICPGGIGYDINCLAGDARVLHAHGYTRRIEEMADAVSSARLTCFALARGEQAATAIDFWLAQLPQAPVLRVVTEGGDELRATADHPFWTPRGMVPLGELKPGDAVAVAPFEGVPYEAPSDEAIVSEEDVLARLAQVGRGSRGSAAGQVLNTLRARGLLPLRYSSPGLPALCKVLGFLLGDGSLHFRSRDGKGVVLFSGQKADLELIRADLATLGVTPSRVYSRQRQHAIHNGYADYSFSRQEDWFKVGSTSLAVLLLCLGAPAGKKPDQSYDAPAWLDGAPRWQKRLFLAALFGAELTCPATVTGHGTVFGAPTLSMNKRQPHAESGQRFLARLADWLAEFGVATQAITADDAKPDRHGQPTRRLRLILSPRSESLRALWGRVGYEYNRKRRGLAALAVGYLKHKGGFPTFNSYCAAARENLDRDGMIWDRVAAVEGVEHNGPVYDFTVCHPDHNFVANGFVVSNCGVRLVRSNLFYREVKGRLQNLVDELFRSVPSGVGRSGHFRFDRRELARLLGEGAPYLRDRDLATAGDLEHTEAGGHLDGADPALVSEQALNRGAEQCGTLGSGNHFLEVQVVDHLFDEEVGQALGLEKDMVCVMIHSGSRGLGYQVCDDNLVALRGAPAKYGIDLPDRQLACAPVDSPEGQRYIGAMRAAANFAWCNRQLLMMQAREVFASVFGRTWQELQMNLVYDVCHNIAKFEEHAVEGRSKRLWVHRKGATRAFPPGHPEVPAVYRAVGQPVIIPGDMGRASWVLVGQPGSMERTFGTTCHGAGRVMSRTAAVANAAGRRIDKELAAQGVIARAQSRRGLAEEQPKAYKNVDDVVEVVDGAGLSRRVARMRPIGVIKG